MSLRHYKREEYGEELENEPIRNSRSSDYGDNEVVYDENYPPEYPDDNPSIWDYYSPAYFGSLGWILIILTVLNFLASLLSMSALSAFTMAFFGFAPCFPLLYGKHEDDLALTQSESKAKTYCSYIVIPTFLMIILSSYLVDAFYDFTPLAAFFSGEAIAAIFKVGAQCNAVFAVAYFINVALRWHGMMAFVRWGIVLFLFVFGCVVCGAAAADSFSGNFFSPELQSTVNKALDSRTQNVPNVKIPKI